MRKPSIEYWRCTADSKVGAISKVEDFILTAAPIHVLITEAVSRIARVEVRRSAMQVRD